MPLSPFDRMSALIEAGTPFAVATVVRTIGSTPQVVGAKLITTGHVRERPFGTLGGGCVEADAIDAAREVLETGVPSLREYQLTEELAWNTGLVCGGTMWILAESGSSAMSVGGQDVLAAAVDASRGGAPMALVTQLRREGRHLTFESRVAVLAGGRLIGSFGDEESDRRAVEAAIAQMQYGTARLIPLVHDRDLLIEPITHRPQLVVAGGGHVSKAIARQARLLDFDVTILEDRPEFADPDRFDGAAVIGGDLAANISTFPFGPLSYLVIATRGHKLDADCVLAAAKTTAGYIGVLGSRRKTVLIAEMLRAEGIDESRLSAIHAPVGLDLGGRTPAEIALSVMAEITQQRFGGTGLPLGR